MSGVYGLNWFPTGPGVLKHILRWMGFPHARCTDWRAETGQRNDTGRLEVVAARVPDPIAALASRRPDVVSPET